MSAAACSHENPQTAMEHRAIEVIEAMERLDEAALNSFVNHELGVTIIYLPGAIETIARLDSISFDSGMFGEGWAEWHFADFEVRDKTIRYETLPEFDCNDEKWDKSPGIYCDTTVVARQVSDLAFMRTRDFGDTWAEGEIAELRKLEDDSRKFVAIGERGQYSGNFIFYLTRRDGNWWLSVIHLFEPCSA